MTDLRAGVREVPQEIFAARAVGADRTGVLRRIHSYIYRVPYCVPQWNRGTYRALARCLALGRIVRGPDLSLLAEELARYFSVPSVLLCGTGRMAIELALRALGVGRGSEVVVPTFCCTGVVEPVIAVGATPVLADVGDELNLTTQSVELALSEHTAAVIVPHLFGNPADIVEIEALCRARGLALVDDAAQALGASAGGRPLGTFGDAGVVSFGNGKVCFGTGGGVLVSTNPAVLEGASRFPLTSDGAWRGFRSAWSVLIWRRWRRWSLPWAVGLARFRRRRGDVLPRRPDAMRNLDAAVACSLMVRLQGDVAARRERVDAYRRHLEGLPGIGLVGHRPGSACLTQVVRVGFSEEGAFAQGVLDVLRGAGYEVSRSYTPLHEKSEYEGFVHRSVRSGTWSNLLELPCEPSVPLGEVARLCRILRESMEAAGFGRDAARWRAQKGTEGCPCP